MDGKIFVENMLYFRLEKTTFGGKSFYSYIHPQFYFLNGPLFTKLHKNIQSMCIRMRIKVVIFKPLKYDYQIFQKI